MSGKKIEFDYPRSYNRSLYRDVAYTNAEREFLDKLNKDSKMSHHAIKLMGLTKLLSLVTTGQVLGVDFTSNSDPVLHYSNLDKSNGRMTFHEFRLSTTSRESSFMSTNLQRRYIFDALSQTYNENTVTGDAIRLCKTFFDNDMVETQEAYKFRQEMKSSLEDFATERNTTVDQMLYGKDAGIDRNHTAFRQIGGRESFSLEAFTMFTFGPDWEKDPEAVAKVGVLRAACGFEVHNQQGTFVKNYRSELNANGAQAFSDEAIFHALVSGSKYNGVVYDSPLKMDFVKAHTTSVENVDAELSNVSLATGGMKQAAESLFAISEDMQNTDMAPSVVIAALEVNSDADALLDTMEMN